MPKRTDLAVELRENIKESVDGVLCTEEMHDSFKITRVKIETNAAAEKIGKPVGSYITLEAVGHRLENEQLCSLGAELLARELDELIKKHNADSVLAVGLGNRFITPDSVGPKAVADILVTRHLKGEKEFADMNALPSVSAIAPGVLGLTGIETGEIVRGIKEHIAPRLIIAIDALAAQSVGRLGTTVQLSDTGICPGSGVGNNRRELSQKSLGVPVIAIGVPMVVDAATLTDNVLDIADEYVEKSSNGKLSSMVPSLSQEERAALIREALENNNLIVSPNDADALSRGAAMLIADGINRALYKL